MMTWVVREYIEGPLDGQYVEGEGSPPPFSTVHDEAGLCLGGYVLTAWSMPVATYRWREGATNIGDLA